MAFKSKIPDAKVSEFLRLARERYEFARQWDAEDRADAEEDVLFCAALDRQGGGTTQWDAKEAARRIDAGRPCLTENRLPTFTAQVVNDGRQTKPAIRITEMDGGTKETAEYYQGRVRQIEYESEADIAYDSAREQQVTSGRAFIRLTTEWEPGTRRQRARIERIENQFSVVYGPSRRYDCSDADYCFVVTLLTKEEHARRHGTDAIAASIDFASTDNPATGWLGTGPNGEMIQEAEYWLKEYRERTRCELSNGKTCWKDELPDVEALGITIENTWEENDVTVMQYIIDGVQIHDETEIIGPLIPISPLWGREQWVQNKRRTASLIRYAKTPQRLLNVYVSNIAEQVAQMPKTPWMVPVGAIPAGSEGDWAKINTDPLAYIYFQEWDPETNRQLSRPVRVQNEPPIQALVLGYNQAVDAIKAAMGLYDASLGARSNETSSVAIESRKRESDNANFHFHDNEGRTRGHIGRILLNWITVLDAGVGSRIVRAEDGKTRVVRVGEPYHDEVEGKIIHHDLATGNYGVSVSTGQSFTSQKQEAFGKMTQMAQAWPQLLQIGGDIILRNADMPGADQLADRLEKLLPPNLQPQKPGQQGQIPPEVQQKVQMIQQQANQALEQLTQTVHRLQDEIDSQQVQMASRERITAMQEETKRVIALAQLNQREGLALLEQDIATVKHQLELHQAELDRKHAAEQAQLVRQHEVGVQGLQHAHDAATRSAPAPAPAPGAEAETEPTAAETPEPPTEPVLEPQE